RAIAALVSVPAIALLAAGCSEEEKATSQVIFDGRLERGSGMNCQDVGPLFTVGDFGLPSEDIPAKPIPDGEPYEQGTVSVSCSVAPSGTDEFRVKASVVMSGA